MQNKILGMIIIIVSVTIIIIYSIKMKKPTYNDVQIYDKYDNFVKDNIYGILEIPKIKIKSAIYNINDERNDVNKNILLINDEKNLIILAAHSGSSPISYFNKLYLLDQNDKVIFNNGARLKTYELFKKVDVIKKGKIKIEQFPYPIIVLITCKKTNNKFQELYYARLVLSEKIA